MMKHLIVSIDTEEDMPDWRPEEVTTTQNILSLPRLQQVFDRNSVSPTYLVDQPVLENDKSLEIIQQLSQKENCEIGAHLHSWNTPPISLEEENGKATYLSAQSEARIKQKIYNFTEVFHEALGFYPTSYRAGRYGFCRKSALFLADLGYSVDSSIAPLMNFVPSGGPNFREYDLSPFWIKSGSKNELLELPITISLVHRFPSSFDKLYYTIPDWCKVKGILHRLNLARFLWLRPTTYSLGEMRQLADHVLDCSDTPILNIMFHSSEVCAGASPYNRTEEDVENFLKRLDAILSYLIDTRNLQSITMTGFADMCKKEKKDTFVRKTLLGL